MASIFQTQDRLSGESPHPVSAVSTLGIGRLIQALRPIREQWRCSRHAGDWIVLRFQAQFQLSFPCLRL